MADIVVKLALHQLIIVIVYLTDRTKQQVNLISNFQFKFTNILAEFGI